MRQFRLAYLATFLMIFGCIGGAKAEDLLTNNGLIEQVVDLDGAMTMEQERSVGSLQAGNLVAAGDTVVNNGDILQEFTADRAEMTQDWTVGSVQVLNGVMAGNPMASGFGR